MKSSSIDDDMIDDDDDDVDDENEDDMENGLQALGLMGNVAYMNNDSFKCPVCGLQLDSQHTFTLHIRSHNPNDHSNTCSLCGKTLSSASSLDRHMLIHSGERPFKCSLCGMAFTTNGNMHRHMRTHGHGSIGYTPRGQKRRAKLLTQALEKAMAAAAAGEEVDYEAINKLKKSILESKVTVPTTTGGKRQSKNQQQQSAATTFSEQLLSSLAPNVSIEAAAAAAVAAAHNAAGSKDGDSILSHLSAAAAAAANSQHQSGSGRKHRNRNSHTMTASHHHNTAITPKSSNDKNVAKESPINTTSASNMPLNLANNPMVSNWSTKHHSTTPTS
ncbi:Zinc-finger double domain containing protein, partial [Euroglyphus maynei]